MRTFDRVTSGAGQVMDELLTTAEVATYLRVSRATIWRWCQDQKVPAFKIGREWRIIASALQPMTILDEIMLRSPKEKDII